MSSSVYTSLTFDDYNWRIDGPLSSDLVAGLIAAIKTVLSGPVNIRLNDRELVINQFDHYILKSHLSRGELLIQYLPPNKYGWAIADAHGYNLYIFETNEFVRGFISMCDAFQVDFRDYIAGPPFKTSNRPLTHTFYYIQNYDIDPILLGNRQQNFESPYYTYVHEDYDEFNPVDYE